MSSAATPSPPAVRGWCPGVLDPMERADGWLARVRLVGGSLTAAEAYAVADAANQWGSGIVECTGRANLQIRGVLQSGIDPLALALQSAGLSSGDAAVDRCRAVIDSPFAPDDGLAASITEVVTTASLEHRSPEARGLPAKFSVLIDRCDGWPVHEVDADIRVVVSSAGTFVCVDRTAPVAAERVEASGSSVASRVSTPSVGGAVDVVGAVARVCASEGRRAVSGDLAAHTTACQHASSGLEASSSPCADETSVSPGSAVFGWHHRHATLVAAAPNGRLSAEQLRSVAQLAESVGARLGVHTRRGLALRFPNDPDQIESEVNFAAVVASAERGLRTIGFLVDDSDPRLAVTACVGSAGCPASWIDTTAGASQLANQLVPVNGVFERVHLSGCPKGCGAPLHVRHVVAEAAGLTALSVGI